MSRTFKDKKEEKAKRLNREPHFKKSYRDVLEQGFSVDLDCDTCPDCGATMNFERGFFSCEECGWGSFFPEELNREADLDFLGVA